MLIISVTLVELDPFDFKYSIVSGNKLSVAIVVSGLGIALNKKIFLFLFFLLLNKEINSNF